MRGRAFRFARSRTIRDLREHSSSGTAYPQSRPRRHPTRLGDCRPSYSEFAVGRRRSRTSVLRQRLCASTQKLSRKILGRLPPSHNG